MAGESMMSDKKTGAVDYGKKHNSCTDAMEWRESLGPTATQADAYLACDRGDWLIWQLDKLTPEQYAKIKPALNRAIEKIVARAIRRGVKSLRGVRAEWATDYRRWARRWLSGEDRTWAAAREAAAAAGEAAWEAAREAAEAAGEAAWEAAWAVAREAEAAAGEAAWEAAWAVARAAAREAAGAAARAAAREAARAAAEAAELKLQARDIRREIPAWTGE